jgi:Ca-activated chloride channel homolog
VRMARLDESGLSVVASAGGGHYQRLGTGEPVDLFDQAAGRDPSQALTDGQGLDRWVERGPWLLLPLLVIAAAGFRRGWLGLLVLLLVPPPQAQAFGWQDLWMRPDQQASRLLERGEAKAAAERFQDPHWRATARYQAGDYAAAAAGFDGDAPDSLYNRGNALARAGHLQEALAAYTAALDRQPDDGDARFNHDLVERLLREQQAQTAQAQPGGTPQDRQQAGAGQSGSANDKDKAGSSSGGQQPGQSSASGSGDERQQSAGDGQAGKAPTGAAASPAGQRPADAQNGKQADTQNDTQAGSPHDRDGDTARMGQAPAEEHGAEQHASADDGQAGQTPSGSTTPDNTDATPTAGPADSAERARADVAPAAADDQPPAQARPGGADETDRKSEQDIAMEQWLRQVPDDPAGLLRRKFMLEHLLRQKGQ